MTLTLEEVPRDYMEGGRIWKADLEIRWPLLYWIPREKSPMGMFYQGNDLSEPTLDVEMWGSGCCACRHTLEFLLWKNNLHLKAGF